MRVIGKAGHLGLVARFSLFLLAFLLALFLQIGISRYQNVFILEPMKTSTDNVQVVSRFLNTIEESLDLLDSYRWDFGSPATLVGNQRRLMNDADEALSALKIGTDSSHEQYFLTSAVNSTYKSYRSLLVELNDLLINGRDEDASALYYSDIEVCGGYLRQYAQELIETQIRDNSENHQRMMALNSNLDSIQNISVILCILIGSVLFSTIIRILGNVMAMARASQEIKKGNFDTPDVDESRRDEIGNLAIAFNDMKHSLKEQVHILEEKREMESTLYRKEKEALELQNHLEREKLQQLRNQINPHFLFNTLNVIKYKSHEEGAIATESLVSSLSRLFRYALQSNENECLLSREVRIVDEFYALTRARFGEKVSLVWSFSPDIDLTTTIVPSFILQPLVENAFKHGLGPKEDKGEVKVSIRKDEEFLRIEVADDGVGMSAEELGKLRSSLESPGSLGEHIGIYNVAARLRLLSSETEFCVESEKNKGTTIAMKLPLTVLEEEMEDCDDQDSDC